MLIMKWLLIIVLVIITYSENSQVYGKKYEENQPSSHRFKNKQINMLEETDKVQKRKKVKGFKRKGRTLKNKRKHNKKKLSNRKLREKHGRNIVSQRKMKRNQKRTQKRAYSPKKQKIIAKSKKQRKTH